MTIYNIIMGNMFSSSGGSSGGLLGGLTGDVGGLLSFASHPLESIMFFVEATPETVF